MMYQNDEREKLLGIASVISGELPKSNYYMSETAIDPGTGLLNKRAINEYAIEKIQGSTGGLYLAIIDVDDFKRINDGFGHMFGDEVLSKVAEIIRSILTGRGMAGRFGGDEFMLVFENVDSEETLRRMLSTISKHVKWAFVDEKQLSISLSIGVSKFPEDGATYEDLFMKADKCLYIAKAKGKDRYIIYNEEKHGNIVNEEDSVRSIGLKATDTSEKKCSVLMDLVLELHRSGMTAVPDVMKQMQAYFDIDGIAVYGGSHMERLVSAGRYLNPIQNYDCVFQQEYRDFFDEDGYYIESGIFCLEQRMPRAFELNRAQEIEEFMQFLAVGENGVPKALVSFDFFNRRPKISAIDIGMMKTVGRLLAEVAAERQREKGACNDL